MYTKQCHFWPDMEKIALQGDRQEIYLSAEYFFLDKRVYQCVSGFNVVVAIGCFLFSATEVGSMKYKMEGENRVHIKMRKI